VTHYDVAVVGSGPAGSAAALALVRRGARVVVLEREALPRYKTCGGGVVHRAAALAGLDLGPIVERPCPHAALHFHDIDRHFFVQREQPITLMTMRDRLDFLLASAAERAGARLLAPCRVREVVSNGRGVRLGTDREPVSADFVVAADGALGDVARLAGWNDDRHLVPALEYEVTVDDATLDRFAAGPRFDFGTVPHGYAWVFPKATHLSVGVLNTHRGARDLHERLAHYLGVIGIAPQAVRRHGYVIPMGRRSGPLVRGRVLLVGDAAGLADPLTAEGISFALASGQIAGEVLARGLGDETAVRAAFHAELRKAILPELRIGRFLAGLVYERTRLRRWLFRSYGQGLTEALADVFLGRYGYRHIPGRALRRVLRRLSA
jgi:geranylgeranyl reductase family protein